MKFDWRLTFATLATGALLFAGGAAANADALVVDEGEGWYAVVDGEVHHIEAGIEKNAPAQAEEGHVTPYLIGFDQWARCFTFNVEGTTFASYTWWWDGVAESKKLMCGTGGWGYKHIKDEHETHWQGKLNKVLAQGLGQDLSWDDVAAAGIYASLNYPDFTRVMPNANKMCAVGILAYFKSDGTIVDYFNVTTSFATDSERIITTFPHSNGDTC